MALCRPLNGAKNMQLHKTIASSEEKDAVIRKIKWCQENHLAFAGLPYTDNPAGPDGIHLEILVPENFGREICEQALREGYRERNVLSHSVKVCPTEWFQSVATAKQSGTEGEQRFVNHYRHCDIAWTSSWSCMCNDRCTVCNKEIEPYESTVVDTSVNHGVAGADHEKVETFLNWLSAKACYHHGIEDVMEDIGTSFDPDVVSNAIKHYGVGFDSVEQVYQSMREHT